jgi:E3 ubiquitin-protein ligase RNF14
MEYIKETSKQCPNCKSWMQKLDGCNKMVCSKCTCYFCWLCSKILSRNDPYSHFNQTQSSCFEKLFEGAWSNNGDENNNNNNDQENADSNSDDDDHELPRLEHLDLEEGDFIYEDDAEDDGIIFRH